MTTYFVTKSDAKTAQEARKRVEDTLWDYNLMLVDVKPIYSLFRLIGWNVSFVALGV